MITTTAAGRTSLAAVVVLVLGVPLARPALAHSEGVTPYRYVVAPPGVASQGAAGSGLSTQPIGRPGFAGTTDNQMQLTLPERALPAMPGQTGVRVQLEQLDPARLPGLPAGFEAEGNGYRVVLTYAQSGAPVGRLAAPASLGLSAPAAPTEVYELLDGAWAPVAYTPVTVEEGFSSVVVLQRPGTFLQAFDPSRAPVSRAPGPEAPGPEALGPTVARAPAQTAAVDGGQGLSAQLLAVVVTGLAALGAVAGWLRSRPRRTAGHRPG